MSAARERLIATARVYHAVTTYKELAQEIQVDTGVRTRMLLMNWIGAVLGLVAEDCAKRGEPLLSALCVNQEGSVGRATPRPSPPCAVSRRPTLMITPPTSGSPATGTSAQPYPPMAAGPPCHR